MAVTSPFAEQEMAAGAVLTERFGVEVPEHFGDPAVEYEAVRKRVGLVDLSFRGLIEVTGADRFGWLNGQITNDVKQLRAGEGKLAAVLRDSLSGPRSCRSPSSPLRARRHEPGTFELTVLPVGSPVQGRLCQRRARGHKLGLTQPLPFDKLRAIAGRSRYPDAQGAGCGWVGDMGRLLLRGGGDQSAPLPHGMREPE